MDEARQECRAVLNQSHTSDRTDPRIRELVERYVDGARMQAGIAVHGHEELPVRRRKAGRLRVALSLVAPQPQRPEGPVGRKGHDEVVQRGEPGLAAVVHDHHFQGARVLLVQSARHTPAQ